MAANYKVPLFPLANVTVVGANNGADIPLNRSGRAFVGYLKVGAVAGTSPTLDVVIQHSVDGVSWITLLTFAQLTAGNQTVHTFLSAVADYNKPILPHVRAVLTLGGSATPSFSNVECALLVDPNT